MRSFIQRSISVFLAALLLITSLHSSVFLTVMGSEYSSIALEEGTAAEVIGGVTSQDGAGTVVVPGGGQDAACNHTYWGDCDADCNECQEPREPLADHRYSGDCDIDCDVCMEDRTPLTDHQYDDNCDEYCNTCGSLRRDCHRYDHSCDTTCNDCGHVREINHTYDTLCDPKCNVCGNERITEHLYTSVCDAVCSVCKSVREVEHTFNEWYDHCTVCDTDIDTCGDDIIWFIQDNTLILSGTGEMYHYDFWYDTVPWGSDIGEIHKVWVSEGITSLGTNAFCDFVNMTDAELPSTLKKMWMNAFAACESLSEITIPSGLEAIDVSAFANCTALRTFKVAEGNTHFTVMDGVLFNSDMTVLWAYPIGSTLEIYEMPNTVERVEAYAFSEAVHIKEIKFSENLKHIDDEAFHNCIGLTSITLPDGFESTGGGAFQGCENLSGIHLPDTMTRIGPLTFDQTAYYNNLSNWENDMVLYLGNYLLQARGKYDEIAGESGLELGGEYTVKDGTTLIADEAFFLLWNVSDVHLPSSLRYIGDGAFCSCKGLRDVVIPEGVTHIGDTAFWLNPDLQSVTLPSGLQYIGSMAFDESAYLASIANADTPLGYVNGYIIGTHSSLKNADLPEDTVLIAENAFEAAGSSLQSVTLPESLRVIGDEAFINNRNLKNVTVPASVEFIGDYAFGYTKYYASDAEGYVYNQVDQFVLSGYTDSSADKYAKKFNITFDYLDGCDHEYTSSVTTPNTCTAAGVRTYNCKFCNDFYTESIPAGHTNIVIDPAVEPGCNTNGMTEGSHCEACGEVIITQTPTASLNHIIVAEMHEGATCGQGGYTMGVYCKTCEKYLVEPEYIPPTGDHRECTMDEIAATCVTEGRTGGTFCQWCGQTVVEPTVIPKNNNHQNVVYDFGYPPTCTTDGAGDGSHCEDCGAVIVAQQTIPTSGHTYDNSCDVTCNTCGENRTITHAFEDGVCIVCGEQDLRRNGWILEGSKWYFYENGEKVANCWKADSKGWVFLGVDGAMLTNAWCKDSKGWCYVGADGYAVTNCWKQDSIGWIWLDSNGSMTKNAWISDGGKWYFLDEKGYMVSNCWKKDSKGWCWLTASGAMAVNQWVKDSKGWCYVGSDGYCWTNCWAKDSIGWIWLDKEGSMTKNAWVLDGGSWYWLDGNGYMVSNTSVRIGGKVYRFNASGICTNP